MVLFFPYAFTQIGKAATCGFLAAVSITQAVFTWLFVPEIKGKPLEEIEAFWTKATGTVPLAARPMRQRLADKLLPSK